MSVEGEGENVAPEPVPVEAQEDVPTPAETPQEPEPVRDVIFEELGELLVFDKWSFKEIVVEDQGLKRYINLKPITIPHSGAKHANKTFGKRKVNIVERLINNMMRTEDFTGKKTKAYSVVKEAFMIIEKREKQNPIQVLIEGLQNSAPREEITRLKFGGISVPKAVDISPSRRLDIALRNICRGAVGSTFKNKRDIATCLANEIINASHGDMNSFAVSKKEEKERVAMSAR